jgi:IS66 Orf2 like protein
MIPHGVEVFVGLDPIDLRWGFERLSGVITEKLGRSSRCGALFVFFGKRRTALKILFFDGGGSAFFTSDLIGGRSGSLGQRTKARPCSRSASVSSRIFSMVSTWSQTPVDGNRPRTDFGDRCRLGIDIAVESG